MKKTTLFIMTLLLLAILIAGCKQSGPQNGSSNNSTTAADNSEDADGWGLSINTTDLYGADVTNESFSENKLTILNIWATWCMPCIQELPELQKISDAYAEQGVQVVGVLQDGITELGVPNEQTIQNALKLLENADASYTVILPDETLVTEFINTMQYFPTTFFINSTGNVVHTVIGANDFENWSKEIDEVLKQLS